jgi:pyruvate-formate lyase-activating enzyme
MTARIQVQGRCATPCPACVACTRQFETPLADVVAAGAASRILLGGGDATVWPHLDEFLSVNAQREKPQQVWLEAPAKAFTGETLERLRAAGVVGLLVQIEAHGEAMRKALRVGDGEAVITRAEELGFEVEARICVRPKTFPIVVPLARRLAPRRVWLEIVRQDFTGRPQKIPPGSVALTLAPCQNLGFSAHRMSDRGYLPPCVLPDLWDARPTIWRSTLSRRKAPNSTLPSCKECDLAQDCRWSDSGALEAKVAAEARPVRIAALTWGSDRPTQAPVPRAIARPKSDPEVICVTPWTTMEVVDPDGRARQCCSTWTLGDRGNVLEQPLLSVWNGAGYRLARKIMSGRDVSALCQPICSRLHDRKFSETNFTIQSGSEAFVENQLRIAEDIAERREVTRGRPLRLALCPSTYCNYNCIMCDHGRSPRRDLSPSIWEEVAELMPTLQTLTLLGGEPLANPHTMRFLREFDAERWPDAAVDVVTNGSLLTTQALKHLKRCRLGNVTLSANAGTAETYERVQRGLPFEQWLANLDALLSFRAEIARWFGITLSFVLQPAASASLIPFGEIAHRRNLPIRLMALNPENHEGLDFYLEDETVQRVLADVDAFAAWARATRPEWLGEILSGRAAVVGEWNARRAGVPRALSGGAPERRLRVVP